MSLDSGTESVADVKVSCPKMAQAMDKPAISRKNGVKFALPFPCSSVSEKRELLDSISLHVAPDRIVGAMLTGDYFTVYLASFEDVLLLLLKRTIMFRDMPILAIHLVNAFTLYNVPPLMQENELRKIFSQYGTLEEIQNLQFCPNTPKYSHILGSERRIYLHTPDDGLTVPMPEKVSHGLSDNLVIEIAVQMHCVLCNADGHSYNLCSNVNSAQMVDVKPFTETSDYHSAAEGTSEEKEGSKSPDAASENDLICIPSSVFEYIPSKVNGPVVLSVQSGLPGVEENSSFTQAQGTESSTAVQPACDDDEDDDDLEEVPTKKTRRMPNRSARKPKTEPRQPLRKMLTRRKRRSKYDFSSSSAEDD